MKNLKKNSLRLQHPPLVSLFFLHNYDRRVDGYQNIDSQQTFIKKEKKNTKGHWKKSKINKTFLIHNTYYRAEQLFGKSVPR